MRRILSLALLATLFSITSYSQTTEEKEKAIRELIELSGVRAAIIPAMENMIAMRKQNNQSAALPDEFWQEFTSEKNINKFVEAYVPIYDKNYTYQEVIDISAFYRSHSGKSMVEKMPALMTESIQVGGQIGQQIGQEIAEKMVEY